MYVVNRNDRKRVVDARVELNTLTKDEICDIVVLAFANSLTSSLLVLMVHAAIMLSPEIRCWTWSS